MKTRQEEMHCDGYCGDCESEYCNRRLAEYVSFTSTYEDNGVNRPMDYPGGCIQEQCTACIDLKRCGGGDGYKMAIAKGDLEIDYTDGSYMTESPYENTLICLTDPMKGGE